MVLDALILAVCAAHFGYAVWRARRPARVLPTHGPVK